MNRTLNAPLLDKAKRAIIAVGDNQYGQGRGFVVESSIGRLVITAAHCLPRLPPAHPCSYVEERTYVPLLGLRHAESSVAAQCVFVDPIADVAVLSAPDSQGLPEQFFAYEALVESVTPLPIASVLGACDVALLTHMDTWDLCTVRPDESDQCSRSLVLVDASSGIAAGCSGSPIIDMAGRALGVVSVAVIMQGGLSRECPDQPALVNVLPAWLAAAIGSNTRDPER
jgi:hypothetical protein